MTEEERNSAARKRKAQERLGDINARCPICGENNPHCLEHHHIAGRKFSDDTIWVCRNCHRKLSDAQLDHPKPLNDDPDWMERLGHYLLGLVDLIVLAVQKFKEFGHLLIDKAKLTQAGGGGA